MGLFHCPSTCLRQTLERKNVCNGCMKKGLILETLVNFSTGPRKIYKFLISPLVGNLPYELQPYMETCLRLVFIYRNSVFIYPILSEFVGFLGQI